MPVNRRDQVLLDFLSIPPSPPREPVGHGGPKFVVPPSGGVFNSDRLKAERRTRWANTMPELIGQIKRERHAVAERVSQPTSSWNPAACRTP